MNSKLIFVLISFTFFGKSFEYDVDQIASKIIVKVENHEKTDADGFLQRETLSDQEFERLMTNLKNRQEQEKQIILLKNCNANEMCMIHHNELVKNIRDGKSDNQAYYEYQINELMRKSLGWTIEMHKKLRGRLLAKTYKYNKSQRKLLDERIIEILNEDSKKMDNLYLNDTEVTEVLEENNLTEDMVLELKRKLMIKYHTNDQINHNELISGSKKFHNKFNPFDKLTKKAKLKNENIEIMKHSGLPIEILKDIKDSLIGEYRKRRLEKKLKTTTISPFNDDYESDENRENQEK